MKYLYILLLTVVLCSCKDNATSKKELATINNNANKSDVNKTRHLKSNLTKVTFIELGSVKCIPCRKMQKVIKSVEEKYGDQVQTIFYDVWTEEGKPYAETYNIKAIPTQIFLDGNGHEFFRHESFFPYDELMKVLNKQGVE